MRFVRQWVNGISIRKLVSVHESPARNSGLSVTARVTHPAGRRTAIQIPLGWSLARKLCHYPKMASPGRISPGRGCLDAAELSAKGPVSRILSCAVIPLGAASPRTLISDLPGGFGHCMEPPERAGPTRNAAWLPANASLPIWSCSVWGLPCLRRYRRSGALLPHHFTLTPAGGLAVQANLHGVSGDHWSMRTHG